MLGMLFGLSYGLVEYLAYLLRRIVEVDEAKATIVKLLAAGIMVGSRAGLAGRGWESQWHLTPCTVVEACSVLSLMNDLPSFGVTTCRHISSKLYSFVC